MTAACARQLHGWPLLLLAGLGLAGCAGLPAPSCQPSFPYEDGWLGGDAAYSVPLGATRTLWLFGDSFVGEPGQGDRVGAHFVHNSIGISGCEGSAFRIDYTWGRDAEGQPVAFLRETGSDRERRWWWLFGGFVHDGRLYLGLLDVEHTPPRGPLALPFRATGMRLARIENPGAAPSAWRTSVLPLWPGAEALPASALLIHERWLYLFSFLQREDGSSPRVLARLPLAALEEEPPDLPGSLHYLARDGRWKPGLDPADARVLMDDDATEMSVRWHEDLGRWLALYSHPSSPAVRVRTAAALTGPWSEERAIYLTPELDPGRKGRDPATACYAAKEHAQFSPPGGVTFTYVCNLFTPPGADPNAVLRRLQLDMSLYRPRSVTLGLPPGLVPTP